MFQVVLLDFWWSVILCEKFFAVEKKFKKNVAIYSWVLYNTNVLKFRITSISPVHGFCLDGGFSL